MNPFFENSWTDAHTVLIGELRNALNADLPDDLRAKAEEGLRVTSEDKTVQPDVAVVESRKSGKPSSWQPEQASEPDGGLAIEASEPYIIEEEATPRWVEIRTVSGNLVTVIELLSPSNKQDDRFAYVEKRERYRGAGVNVVEIDLIRRGESVTLVREAWREKWRAEGNRLDYEVAVWRASGRQIEMYPVSLRESLPVLRIPLRPYDRDVPLALQPLVDRCHVNGRYWQERDVEELQPGLSDEDAAWVGELLGGRAH